jgi:hypothetical protein
MYSDIFGSEAGPGSGKFFREMEILFTGQDSGKKELVPVIFR